MAEFDSPVLRWLGELGRRKVIRVAVGYTVVAWVLIQVAETTFEPIGLPPWTLTLVIWLAVLGFPLACVLAWGFDVTSRGVERTVAKASSADVSPQSGEGVRESTPSVAILPFTDMSQAQDQAYFCDGIAEEIINALCCVRGLRIASRTSSFQFKTRAVDAREIGQQLNVGAVLEGSVRKAGNRVRITAQLLNASDGYHVWSQSYDRDLDDVFAIQTDIAQRMVSALRVSLTPRENALIERGGTRSSQAYDFFLRGQQLLWAYNGAEEAPAMFRRAIEHDPSFAQAHAGLANSLAVRGAQISVTPAEIEEASAAIRRALELEPWMPEAFLARACLASQQGRNEDADKDFEESIRLNPKSYFTYYAYGRHCISTRRLDKAAELFRTSAKLAPEEYTPLGMLASALQQMGDKDQQHKVLREGLHKLERHLQRHPNDEAALGRAGVFAASVGETTRAEDYVERAIKARPDGFINFYNAACTYALLGRPDRAIELLGIAAQHGGAPAVGWIETDDDLASLRDDPRYQAIIDSLRATAHD